MICNAHVGVGIAGAEGVQAANASDYSIGRFRFLQRLLLVHGRWNYMRMSLVVLYMFWKNVVFVVAQFFFQTNNGFSGQKWYVEYAAQAFNILFTGAPPLAMGVYDRDVDASWALRFPKLYDHGRLSRGLNLRVFLAWMADAIFNAAVVAGFSMAATTAPSHTSTGTPENMGGVPFVFDMGTVAYSIVVVAVTIRIVAETYRHSPLLQWCVALSALSWVPACFFLDYLRQDNMLGRMRLVFGSAHFWLLLLAATGLLLMRVCSWKGYLRQAAPELRHIVAEANAGLSTAASAEWYADIADLARRLGKPVQEVARAKAGADALAPPVVVVRSERNTAAAIMGSLNHSLGGVGAPGSPAVRMPLLQPGSGGSSANGSSSGFARSPSPVRGGGGGYGGGGGALHLSETPYGPLASPPPTPLAAADEGFSGGGGVRQLMLLSSDAAAGREEAASPRTGIAGKADVSEVLLLAKPRSKQSAGGGAAE